MEGVAAWNQWRAEKPEVLIDLRKADLRDIELPGANLSGANLETCNLRDAVLDGADLSSTRLTSATFTGARLHETSFIKAIGDHNHFNNADASNGNFSEVEFSHSNFTGAKLNGAKFINAVVRDSTFSGIEFNKSDLTQADFRDSKLQNAIFDHAFLEGADLRRCQLNSASLKSAILSSANLSSTDLNGADLTEAMVTRVKLQKITGLTCEQLTKALDWETTYRDNTLACGGEIPDPNKGANVEVPTGKTTTTSYPPRITATKDIDEAIRQRISETPATVVVDARQARDSTIALQTILRDMRLNSPEASQVQELLVKQVRVLDDIVAILQSDGDKEAAGKNLRDLLYDVFKSLLKAIADDGATKGILAMAAIVSLRLTGVDTGFIVETLVAGSIVGIDAKALERILSGWKERMDKGE